MSVRRVMGTETEYGISVPGQPGANAMVTSSQVVNAYQAATSARTRRARWDFEEENPLRDARGFDLTREAADSSQLTDEDLGLANVILTNGARLYVDHAHPEYSTPECTNPLAAVIWDKAGERVMAEAAVKAATVPGRRAHPAVQEQHRQQGRLLRLPRELPDAPGHAVRGHRAEPHPVLRLPAGRLRCGPGRPGCRRPERGLPDQPAGRLLRGRGRPGDHAQAADHQHPRRAARRPGEVPPPARDHRRREHERGQHLPQARHDRAGAGDDRGAVPRRRPRAGDRRSPSCGPSPTTRPAATWSRCATAGR